MAPDWLLLRQYARENSQEAFTALTTRYLSLVYAVCLREVHDAEMAQDATQAVFLLLARTAPKFRSKTALPGWLFRTARFAAQNARTREQRRRHYEGKAAQAMQQQMEGAGDWAWAEIEPLLNRSLAVLNGGERDCILLRYFQELSFSETGAALGLSEDAARKRVTRALEKMRRFFVKEGVNISGAALTALLPTHIVKTAPAHLAGELTRILAGALPGHILLISHGVSQTMKLFKLKVAAGAASFLLVGAATYAVLHAVPANSDSETRANLDDPINAAKNGFAAPGQKDAVRNVSLVGSVRHEDGRPAGGVEIAAQIQVKAMMERSDALRKRAGLPAGKIVYFSKAEQEESWNNTVSKADGSYELPVAAGIPYNVMVFDTTGKWVAAAVEGASGAQNSVVKLPDLILTKGALVAGQVTTSAGVPLPHVGVACYGPHRPATSAGVSGARTDWTGHYRLRVAPGFNRVYTGNVSHSLDVEAGIVKTVDFAQ